MIDAYKVKDKAVMKVRIKAEEYEVPFEKLNIRYSDKYLTEYKKILQHALIVVIKLKW